MNVPRIAAAVALALAAATLGAGASSVPCRTVAADPVGCPDLGVDSEDLGLAYLVRQTFAESSCAVVEGMVPPGDRTLLRFPFTTPNLGTGDLVVGKPSEHPEWFEWSGCHLHYHFREYADYRLWTLDGYAAWSAARAADPLSPASEVLAANPGLAGSFVAGNKLGFCVIDVVPATLVPTPKKHGSCFLDQGISLGWADSYDARLDGQWIDVTGLPEGDYVLEAEVNAERLFDEIAYANNAAAVYVPIYPVD